MCDHRQTCTRCHESRFATHQLGQVAWLESMVENMVVGHKLRYENRDGSWVVYICVTCANCKDSLFEPVLLVSWIEVVGGMIPSLGGSIFSTLVLGRHPFEFFWASCPHDKMKHQFCCSSRLSGTIDSTQTSERVTQKSSKKTVNSKDHLMRLIWVPSH